MSDTPILSLSTFSLFPLRFDQVLREAARAGFSGLELVLTPVLLRRSPQAMAKEAASYGLTIHSVHQILFGVGPWRDPARRIGDAVDVGLATGASCVVLHVPQVPTWDNPLASRWRTVLLDRRQTLEDERLHISLEGPDPHATEGEPSVLSDLRDLSAFARQHGLSVTLDTTHVGAAGLDLMASHRTVRDELVNVHLSDSYLQSPLRHAGLLRPALADHQMLGRGDLPLAPFLSQVGSSGYRGLCTLELSPFALRSWAPLERAQRLKEALHFMQAACDGSEASMATVTRDADDGY